MDVAEYKNELIDLLLEEIKQTDKSIRYEMGYRRGLEKALELVLKVE
jgi:hypothetical protein